jgi:hypothetical protein
MNPNSQTHPDNYPVEPQCQIHCEHIEQYLPRNHGDPLHTTTFAPFGETNDAYYIGGDFDWRNYEEEREKNLAHIVRHQLNTSYISKTDSCNKYSTGYRNCTAVVAIGTDKKTGVPVSFLTHQDPGAFLAND